MSDSDSQTEDKKLMSRIANRDAEALEQLFARHAPTMLAIGRRMLASTGEADDVLNQVFWEVWSRSDRYDPSRGSVHAYLYLMMRSRCLDALRSRKARPDMGSPASIDGNHTHAEAGPTPAQCAEQSEEHLRIRKALSELNEHQRVALSLSFYEGLSHRQIADRLGQPVGTIKGRLRSGLIKLRDLLRTKGGE